MNSTSPLRLTISAAGTPFLDGYSTASAAFILLLFPGMQSWEMGVFTSLYLFAFSFASTLFGFLADRFGRSRLFSWSMAALALAAFAAAAAGCILKDGSAAALFVLFALRFAAGLFLGGDYPVGQALVAECIPHELRTRHLSLLMYGWYVGAVFAVLLSWPVMALGWSWSAFLWVQAVFALLLWLGRRGVKESGEWRLTRSASEYTKDVQEKAANKRLPQSEKRAFSFCTVFWLCQSIPATVLMFYSTKILEGLVGMENAFWEVFLLYGCFLLGVLPSAMPSVAARPKAVLIGTFLAMAAALGAMSLDAVAASPFLMGCGFVVFSLAYGLQTPLDFVFPNLLFSAERRAGLVGLITTISRIGTTAAALAFPLLAQSYEVSTLFLGGTAILLGGALFSIRFAPRLG